jgi:hypothetical protein
MSGAGGAQQQPEEKSFLGFPERPPGDAEGVKAGRHYWYELAGEISGAFAEIDRAVSGMRWSGDARRAFDGAWSQFAGHGTEGSQHAQEMGDQLLRLGNQIEDAQHQWDLAMAAMAASTAIGIGLTFVTFGVSDAVAEGAATAAVGTMEAVCTALDISLDAAVQVLSSAIRVAVQLAVKFTWQFGINVASQETANVVEGRGLGDVDLLQAAEFAGVSMVIPGVAGRLTIGGREVLSGIPGAVVTGAATDAAVQGLEGVTEGKPFSVGEMLASGLLAGGGHAVGEGVTARLGGGGEKLHVAPLHDVEGGPAAGGANFMAPGDPFPRFAARAAPEPGYYDVTVHGSARDFGASPSSWKAGETFSHRQLARLVSQRPDYQGEPIRLMACRTGAPGATAAQNLANKLGVEVMAPSDTLWAWPDGRLTIGPTASQNTGQWERFLPGGRP